MVKTAPKILVINSDKKELKKVDEFLSAVLKELKLDQSNYNKALLCISEAVINSIEHGNQYDLNKKVTIEISHELNTIQVKIVDEGDGFNFDEIKDPTKNENILSESGRGIHIIKMLSNSIKYNNKGNSLKLKIECK